MQARAFTKGSLTTISPNPLYNLQIDTHGLSHVDVGNSAGVLNYKLFANTAQVQLRSRTFCASVNSQSGVVHTSERRPL